MTKLRTKTYIRCTRARLLNRALSIVTLSLVLPLAAPARTPGHNISSPEQTNVAGSGAASAPLLETKINPIDGAVMIFIPPGEFLMGDDNHGDNPRHMVTLSGYWMYRDLVTVGEYKKFCSETGRKMPPEPSFHHFNPGWSRLDQPMSRVSWNDASAYSKWAGVSLPTDAQFEKSARGGDGRIFPWGNTFDKSKLWSNWNINDRVTHAAGQLGVSPYGCTDMAGSVWEWCQDYYDGGFAGSPQGSGQDPVNQGVGDLGQRVMRGGSWADRDEGYFYTTRRSSGVPTRMNDNDGFRCAASGNSDTTAAKQVLQSNPAIVNTREDSLGNLPLNIAAICAWSDVADLLTASGANVQSTNNLGDTPLHSAAHNADLTVPKMLLQHGAKVNAINNDGETPLMCASQYGQDKLVQFLLDNGATIGLKSDTGETALSLALKNHQIYTAQILIKAHAPINTRSGITGDTPLIAAAGTGNVEVERFLISSGADISIKSADGSTAIHKAAQSRNIETVFPLVAAGCDVNAANGAGDTALIIAARLGLKNLVQDLISLGTDPQAVNRAGLSARDEAARNHRQDVVDVIDQYTALLPKRVAQNPAAAAYGQAFKRGFAAWPDPTMQSKEVYNNDFASGIVGSEWSNTSDSANPRDHADLHISVTPKSNQHFLGEFGNQRAVLTIPNLPPHRQISIAVDLFIIRTWDGNHLVDGPDLWNLSVVRGPSLLNTTFNNSFDTGYPSLPCQSYPGDYPEFHSCRSGADEKNTLGFTFDFNGKTWNMDAVYKLRYTFPHTEGSIAFSLQGNDLQELTDESWGFTNVKVAISVDPPVAKVITPLVPAKPTVASQPTLVSHKSAVAKIHRSSPKKAKHPAKKTAKSSSIPWHPRKKALTP